MADRQTYREMYRVMAQAVESAVRVLIDAQQKCEELYISDEDDAADPEELPPQCLTCV